MAYTRRAGRFASDCTTCTFTPAVRNDPVRDLVNGVRLRAVAAMAGRFAIAGRFKIAFLTSRALSARTWASGTLALANPGLAEANSMHQPRHVAAVHHSTMAVRAKTVPCAIWCVVGADIARS